MGRVEAFDTIGVPCTRDRLERPGRRRLLVCGERLGRILAVGEQRLGLFALRARNRQRDHGIFAEAEQLFLAVEAIFQPPEFRAPGLHEQMQTAAVRSEEHTSELQSLMRISYAVFCLKKKKKKP